jgi:cold shock CspA family protein
MRHGQNSYSIRRMAGRRPEPEHRGHVKWFDVGKGYGFLVPDVGDGNNTLYFSERVLTDPNLIPRQGDAVLFDVGKRNGKVAATAVKVLT